MQTNMLDLLWLCFFPFGASRPIPGGAPAPPRTPRFFPGGLPPHPDSPGRCPRSITKTNLRELTFYLRFTFGHHKCKTYA